MPRLPLAKKIEAHALTSFIGAEIRGVDQRQDLSGTAYTFIHQAWLGHKVLLFRNQTPNDPQMVAFSRRLANWTSRRSRAMAPRLSKAYLRCF